MTEKAQESKTDTENPYLPEGYAEKVKEIQPEPTFKDDPKYLAMAKQLATLQDAEKARIAADTQAATDAETKRLKDAGLFDEAQAGHKAELAKMESAHAAEILQRDIQANLFKAGFNNDFFIKGAIAAYDAETGSVDDYVTALAADEANKGFLATSDSRVVHKAAGAVPAGGPDATLRGDKLKAAAKSDDPKIRAQAIAIKEAFYENNGNFDGLYD
jgi:hypothetical protein